MVWVIKAKRPSLVRIRCRDTGTECSWQKFPNSGMRGAGQPKGPCTLYNPSSGCETIGTLLNPFVASSWDKQNAFTLPSCSGTGNLTWHPQEQRWALCTAAPAAFGRQWFHLGAAGAWHFPSTGFGNVPFKSAQAIARMFLCLRTPAPMALPPTGHCQQCR